MNKYFTQFKKLNIKAFNKPSINQALNLEDPKTLWDELLNAVRDKFDKPTLALLKSLKPKSFENNALIVECQTEQSKNWINQMLGPILKNEFYRKGYSLKLISKEENKEEIIKTQISAQHSIASEYLSIIKVGISSRYTFDNFIVGKQNEVAYKSAFDIANNENSHYNPLFIYGKIGNGKTHILQAIGNRGYSLRRNVIYTSMNDFTEEMVHFLKAGNIIAFREKYKNIDILLIDDIQFLSGKERTQIELFNIFNYLFQHNKHIVFASDKHPREIKDISERLVSRFEGGLLVEIGIDEQIKLSIIKQKVQIYGLNIDERLISYIRDNTTNNAREIEGLVLQIKAKGDSILQKINEQNIVYTKKKEISVSLIKELVANYFNVNIDIFTKSHKNKKYASAKHIAIFLSREYTAYSLMEIAREFSIKSHSSVNHSIKKIEKAIKEDKAIQYSVNSLKELIRKHIS